MQKLRAVSAPPVEPSGKKIETPPPTKPCLFRSNATFFGSPVETKLYPDNQLGLTPTPLSAGTCEKGMDQPPNAQTEVCEKGGDQLWDWTKMMAENGIGADTMSPGGVFHI